MADYAGFEPAVCNPAIPDGQGPTDPSLPTNFPSNADIDSVYDLIEEYTKRFFPKLPYIRLLTSVTEIDEVHGEVQEGQKRWAVPVLVRAFATPETITQSLTKFSLEELRAVVLSISVPDLITAGLITQDPATYNITDIGRIGDHFIYHDVRYVVLTFKPIAFFANTDIPLYYSLRGERYHPEAADLI